jgi:hypothetical protein
MSRRALFAGVILVLACVASVAHAQVPTAAQAVRDAETAFRNIMVNRTRFLWTPTSLTIASNQEGGHGEETGPHPESTSNAEPAGAPGTVERPTQTSGRPAAPARGTTRPSLPRPQVPAQDLESWQRRFLDAGQRGLRTRADPEERELTLAKAKLGELMMRLELAEILIEKRGLTDEWKRSRR